MIKCEPFYFVAEMQLHQIRTLFALFVILVTNQKKIFRNADFFDQALEEKNITGNEIGDEWRIHFHVPLHTSPEGELKDTKNHVLSTIEWLSKNDQACRHLEMETYTWEVLPKELQSIDVVEQVAKEYEWTLKILGEKGLANQ